MLEGVVQAKVVKACLILHSHCCGFISKALVFLLLLFGNAASLLPSRQEQTTAFWEKYPNPSSEITFPSALLAIMAVLHDEYVRSQSSMLTVIQRV